MLWFFAVVLGFGYLVVLPVIAVLALANASRLQRSLLELQRQIGELQRRPPAAPGAEEPRVPPEADAAAPPSAHGDIPARAAETPKPADADTQAPQRALSTAVGIPVAAPAAASAAAPAPTPPTAARARLSSAAGIAGREAAATAAPSLFATVRHGLLTGNPLARLGVVLLFIGLAYLVRYAAEHQLFPIELRLTVAALLAAGLAGLGWQLRHRRPAYALILQGGGIGGLYICCFAAFRLYALLPQGPTLALMLVLCASSVVLALSQRAQSLAVLASLGGYLAPLLLADRHGSPFMLFAYYALLSGGIVAIGARYSWRSLNLIGFLFSFGVGLRWGFSGYEPSLLLRSEFFLLLNLLIFGVIGGLFSWHHADRRGQSMIDSTLCFGTPMVAFGFQLRIVAHLEHGASLSALGFALFYVLLGVGLRRWAPARLATLAWSFVAVGVGFFTLMLALALDAQWTAASWALEGLAMLWIGWRQARRRLRLAGSTLIAAAVASAWAGGWPNLGIGALLGLSGVLALSALAAGRLWLAQPAQPAEATPTWLIRPLQSLESRMPSVFLVTGIALWLIGGYEACAQRNHSSDQQSLMLIVAAASALLWQAAGQWLRWPALGTASALLWPIGGWLILQLLGRSAAPLDAGLLALAWPLALAVALSLLSSHSRLPDELPGWRPLLHGSLVWATGAVIGMQLDAELELRHASSAAVLASHLGLASGMVALLLALHKRWPIAAHAKAYLLVGLGPLLGLTALLLAAANLDSGGSTTRGYLPLLNPLELAAGSALATLGWWMHRVRSTFARAPTAWLQWPLALLTAWWINGLLLRGLTAAYALDWTLHSLWQAQAVQTGLALLWTSMAFACMVAARRYGRNIWFAGIALLVLAVVKLFAVDAADSSGLARAIAFIGVAVLVLIIGYLAPIPPRQELSAADGEPQLRER